MTSHPTSLCEVTGSWLLTQALTESTLGSTLSLQQGSPQLLSYVSSGEWAGRGAFPEGEEEVGGEVHFCQ